MERSESIGRSPDVERFDRWAPTYEGSPFQRWFFDPVHDSTIEAAASAALLPGRILDLGCGTGRLLRRSAQRFHEAALTGADPAKGMVREAKRQGGDRFLVAEAERLPFRDGAFGLVMTTFSFHHWADQRQGIGEVARVLGTGGAFVATDAFPSGGWRFLRTILRHGRMRSTDDMRGMLAAAGFRRARSVAVPRMAGIVRAIVATR